MGSLSNFKEMSIIPFNEYDHRFIKHDAPSCSNSIPCNECFNILVYLLCIRSHNQTIKYGNMPWNIFMLG